MPQPQVALLKCGRSRYVGITGRPNGYEGTFMSIKAIEKPARSLLSPHDHAMILIDHQS
jgi:hypothetical protein